MFDQLHSSRLTWEPCARLLCVLCLTMTCVAGGALADDSRLDNQREAFVLAQAQLKAGDQSGFERTLASLEDYALYDYLVFQQITHDWASREPVRSDVSVLNNFEQKTGHQSLTRRLTRDLQTRLAESEQWALFLGVGKSRVAAGMPCTTLRAKVETGQVKGFDEELIALWVQPKEHPEICRTAIEQVEANHTPPVAAIWERIFQAMEANRPEFAQPMLGYLSSADRRRVQSWLDAGNNPQQLLLSGALSENTVLNRRILADLIVEWSREDTVAAVQHWFKVRDNYTFFNDRYYDTHRALVMRGAYRRLPEAQAYAVLLDCRSRSRKRIIGPTGWHEPMNSWGARPRLQADSQNWRVCNRIMAFCRLTAWAWIMRSTMSLSSHRPVY